MKRIVKHLIVDTASLYLISLVISGLVFEKGITTVIFAGCVLALTTLLIKPVVNLLLLPLNLITLGLFKWIGHAVSLYLVTLIVPGFKILSFHFSGINTSWFVIPGFELTGALAIIAFSFLISFTSTLFLSILG